MVLMFVSPQMHIWGPNPKEVVLGGGVFWEMMRSCRKRPQTASLSLLPHGVLVKRQLRIGFLIAQRICQCPGLGLPSL